VFTYIYNITFLTYTCWADVHTPKKVCNSKTWFRFKISTLSKEIYFQNAFIWKLSNRNYWLLRSSCCLLLLLLLLQCLMQTRRKQN